MQHINIKQRLSLKIQGLERSETKEAPKFPSSYWLWREVRAWGSSSFSRSLGSAKPMPRLSSEQACSHSFWPLLVQEGLGNAARTAFREVFWHLCFQQGRRKYKGLQSLKKLGGGGLNEGFQAVASLTWGWFKLEVKVWARFSFSVNHRIRIYPNNRRTELQEAEDQEVAVKGRGLIPEPASGTRAVCFPWPGQPGAGS